MKVKAQAMLPDGPHSQLAVANPYRVRWREGERRDRERVHTTLCLSYKLQFHSNTKVIATALSEPSFNWSIMNASGGFERTTNFLELNPRQVYKVFSFLEDTKRNEQTWLASRQSTISLKLNLSKQ